MMEKLLKNLAWKCFENDLNFNYSAAVGSIDIHERTEDGLQKVACGYIKDWKWEEPREVLIRIHAEVSKYLADEEPVEDYEVEQHVEYAPSLMMPQERNMKDVGLTFKKDFL